MFKNLKEHFDHIKEGIPGKRFQDHHEWHQEQTEETFAKSVAIMSLGGVMVITGSLLSIPPGVPGFLITVPGLGLIASRFKPLAKGLDKAEVLARAAAEKIKPSKKETPPKKTTKRNNKAFGKTK